MTTFLNPSLSEITDSGQNRAQTPQHRRALSSHQIRRVSQQSLQQLQILVSGLDSLDPG